MCENIDVGGTEREENHRKPLKTLKRKDLTSMLVAIVFILVGATILSLWCSSERRIIQGDNQTNQKPDEAEETRHEEIERYIIHKSHS